MAKATGRGTTYFFEHQSKQFVLRHYLRGGLIGKVLDQQYVYTGLQRTRAWQEFTLLKHMTSLGLPCPTPIAAHIKKIGIYYRADIILSKIPQANDLYNLLQSTHIDSEIWRHIGQTIAKFHRQQVYHHDLNIHNIMLDASNQAWLIDFDKCSIKHGNKWKKANLARLHRSFEKEKANKGIEWSNSDWQHLLAGYHLT
ncbi:3-deoxy-D-manno-octulosonic acid kinase [Paraglaciecola aquimarina]|uniref:3-deoxy-D-manno-octulosonic acid kinase n=1 Tax=Paraglaciecola aquimarina TaxID=1235557 RepID=A0ABU3STX1_9ALTE|nr:3-deoxy-D-manno-octulosonic acid kinase [Paraglaciecola aquimarina]MDU0353458.1 3-deoxy-D-manno-octulosonic acid kinase [Paraglaciecola aquimarina]